MTKTKQAVKRTILAVIVFIVAGLRRVVRKKCIVIVCPPFPSPRNIGDRALVLGAIAAIRVQKEMPLILVAASEDEIPPFLEAGEVAIERRLFRLFTFGGSLFERVRWVWLLRNAESVYMVGADSVDGTYSQTQSNGKLDNAGLAASIGVPTSVVSFSINRLSNETCERLHRLPPSVKLVPRDPVSYQRLCDAGITPSNLGADLSYLVRPNALEIDQDTRSFCDRNAGRLLGVNINNQMMVALQDRPASLLYLAEAYATVASIRELSVLLLPNTDRQFDRFYSDLFSLLRDRCDTHVVQPVPSCGGFKHLISLCEYLFSVSLHVSHFSLSVGTPVTCFPYVGKFEGVLREFEIEDSVINLEELPQDSHDFAEIMLSHYDNRIQRRERIAHNLQHVRELAALNIPGDTKSILCREERE